MRSKGSQERSIRVHGVPAFFGCFRVIQRVLGGFRSIPRMFKGFWRFPELLQMVSGDYKDVPGGFRDVPACSSRDFYRAPKVFQRIYH